MQRLSEKFRNFQFEAEVLIAAAQKEQSALRKRQGVHHLFSSWLHAAAYALSSLRTIEKKMLTHKKCDVNAGFTTAKSTCHQMNP